MTVGPICVQISYNLTEILKEMFACYLQYRCVVTLSTRLTSDLGSVFCPRGAIRLPTIDMSRKGLTPRACMGDGGSICWAPDMTNCTYELPIVDHCELRYSCSQFPGVDIV